MKKTLTGLTISLILIAGLIVLALRLAPESKHADSLAEVLTPEPAGPISQTVSLNFVGDILAARSIELTMRKKGYDYPFEKIAQDLGNADITFANLESPLIGTATTGKTTPGGTTVFRGDIDFAMALKRAGIDVVSIANNHMKDQGQKGVQSTLETLNAAGLAHAGAGLNLDEARSLAILEVPANLTNGHSIKVGFLAYNDSDVVPPSYHATPDQSGTHIMNIPELQDDIAAARPRVDLLIVSMHSGTEYITSKPNARQTEFAHAAVDAGADMVIGHHPHVLQPTETYKGKQIYYSLGNFVFDQPWPDTKQSVMLRMQVKFELSTSTNSWEVKAYYPDITPLQIVQFQPQKTTTLEQARSVFSVLKIPHEVLTLGSEKILVQIASTSAAREQGLSGRLGLPNHVGLLFMFEQEGSHGFWMKDMLFPIDMYWFDKDFKLVGKHLSVTPESYPGVFYPNGQSDLNDLYVLETNIRQLGQGSLTQDLTGELTGSHTYDKK